ncbi:g1681 [Coccomyxa elongata]
MRQQFQICRLQEVHNQHKKHIAAALAQQGYDWLQQDHGIVVVGDATYDYLLAIPKKALNKRLASPTVDVGDQSEQSRLKRQRTDNTAAPLEEADQPSSPLLPALAVPGTAEAAAAQDLLSTTKERQEPHPADAQERLQAAAGPQSLRMGAGSPGLLSTGVGQPSQAAQANLAGLPALDQQEGTRQGAPASPQQKENSPPGRGRVLRTATPENRPTEGQACGTPLRVNLRLPVNIPPELFVVNPNSLAGLRGKALQLGPNLSQHLAAQQVQPPGATGILTAPQQLGGAGMPVLPPLQVLQPGALLRGQAGAGHFSYQLSSRLVDGSVQVFISPVIPAKSVEDKTSLLHLRGILGCSLPHPGPAPE